MLRLKLSERLKILFSGNPLLPWYPIEKIRPEKGQRVLVKCKDDAIITGHLDPDVQDIDVWIAIQVMVDDKLYKFNIAGVVAWTFLPK